MSTPIAELISIVERLRGGDGCPWDQAQTPESMRPYFVEETYEVLEAIDRGEPDALCEELGDLLFQIVLVSEMARQQGWFDLQDVARGIGQKMVERHPHVFSDGHDAESSVAAWEARKAEKRGPDASLLDGVPKALPALLRAHRTGQRVSRVGFDWPDVEGVRAKVDEELAELDEAMDQGVPEHVRAEYGDLLLATANLGRHLGIGPEEALREANAKFDHRFRKVEDLARAAGTPLDHLDHDALEALWARAKETP